MEEAVRPKTASADLLHTPIMRDLSNFGKTFRKALFGYSVLAFFCTETELFAYWMAAAENFYFDPAHFVLTDF
jgi:hypothetical protein